jgi:small subunit ribosomal protein S6
MQPYEIAVLYHPDLEIDLEKPMKKVEKVITDNGGTITNTDNWGKRKLAYTIKKQEFAVYVIYTADLPGESVKKINDTFNITDEVIRFLITRVDVKGLAKAEAARAAKAAKQSENAEAGEDETETADDEK